MAEKKKVSPEISKYMSELAKKRKNPYYGFKDVEKAKEAGERGRQARRAKSQKTANGQEAA